MSTIAELEHIKSLIADYRYADRRVSVLYGIPLPASQVSRLIAACQNLVDVQISVLVDHVDQLPHLTLFRRKARFPLGVFLKVDTGYHRAGLPPWGINKDNLLSKLVALDKDDKIHFMGLYSHSSLSYSDSTPEQAMANLEGEITGCMEALQKHSELFPKTKRVIVSVGASPQVSSIENLVKEDGELSPAAKSLRTAIEGVGKKSPDGVSVLLELHAGVYSLLDIQQLSTKSRPHLGTYEDEIAVSVVTEICSVYNDGERAQPEALASVGVLGLGREPCAAYKGWGVVDRSTFPPGTMDDRRIIVSRVSQEHSILAWDDASGANTSDPLPLTVGQSIRIFPNHACITGAMYGWYLIIDSEETGRETEILEVWTRASPW